MNEYHWEDEAKRDGMDVEIDDDRDINEILDDIRAELQRIGKDRSMTVDDMSRQINYPIYENEELLEKLKRAPMVSYLDPWLRFEPLVRADSEKELKDSLELHPEGVKMVDVGSSSRHGPELASRLVYRGEIIGTNEANSKSVYSIFPRFKRFLVDVSGTATVTANSCVVLMTDNVEKEVRQGDALLIGDQVYRVDMRPLSMQLSVNSLNPNKPIDEGKVKEWHHRVSRQIYLDQPYRGESAKGLKIKRFGVSNDIRTLWLGNQVESIYSNDRELAEAVKKLGSG